MNPIMEDPKKIPLSQFIHFFLDETLSGVNFALWQCQQTDSYQNLVMYDLKQILWFEETIWIQCFNPSLNGSFKFFWWNI